MSWCTGNVKEEIGWPHGEYGNSLHGQTRKDESDVMMRKGGIRVCNVVCVMREKTEKKKGNSGGEASWNRTDACLRVNVDVWSLDLPCSTPLLRVLCMFCSVRVKVSCEQAN